jgi:hypothetical protein
MRAPQDSRTEPIISLYTIYRLVFTVDTGCVLCEVRTSVKNVAQINVSLHLSKCSLCTSHCILVLQPSPKFTSNFSQNAALPTWSEFRHNAALQTQHSVQMLSFLPQLHPHSSPRPLLPAYLYQKDEWAPPGILQNTALPFPPLRFLITLCLWVSVRWVYSGSSDNWVQQVHVTPYHYRPNLTYELVRSNHKYKTATSEDVTGALLPRCSCGAGSVSSHISKGQSSMILRNVENLTPHSVTSEYPNLSLIIFTRTRCDRLPVCTGTQTRAF